MNGIILIDKPQDFTSHDVVAKLRGILRERRIGHSGTLDPMATGLLVVFVGRATRAVEFAECHEKEYIAGMRPGITTNTQDVTGETHSSSDIIVTKDMLMSVIPDFTGEIVQVPPMYSAIKVKGKKLYELARSGIEVEREGRPVTISELELLGKDGEDYILRVVCSKGTYIRTLCHDMGQKLGTGAVLSSLRRTKAGYFSVEDAHTLDEIQNIAATGEIDKIILPVDSMFKEYESIILNDNEKKKCLCGNSFETSLKNGKYRVYSNEGEFLMLGYVENGVLHTIKSFFEV